MRDDLLDRLAAEAVPVRRMDAGAFLGLYGLGIGAALLVIAAMGFRADLPGLALTPMFFWKLLASALIALPGALLLYRCGRPGARTAGGLKALAAIAGAVFAAPFVFALAVDPTDALRDVGRLDWARLCVPVITLATVPIWVAALLWLKRAAPTNLERASWAAGLAAAAMGASLFVLHCPYDSLAYVAFWYLATIVSLAALTRIVMPPLIRW